MYAAQRGLVDKYFPCDAFRTNSYRGLNNTSKAKSKKKERETAEPRGARSHERGPTEIVTNYARGERKAAQRPSELQRMRAHRSPREELSYK